MTYTPTPEAIEAAAKAIYEHHWGGGTERWNRLRDYERDIYTDRAIAALTAAAPFIAAQAWDEGFFDGKRQDNEGDDGPRFINPYRTATIESGA